MQIDDEIAQQFAAMGHRVEVTPEAPADDAFEVMAQNAGAIRAWLAVETQWRVAAGLGGIVWLGLDYTAADVVLRRLPIDGADQVFAHLMTMETEALAVFRESK